METAPALVRVESLRKQYVIGKQPILVLDNINVTLSPHEVTALVGPSGSGKSTLMNLLGGLDRPSDGQIIVDGRNLRDFNDRQLAAYRAEAVGMVFQSFNLLPHLSAIQNVMLPAILHGTTKTAATARATELLTKVGLAGRINHKPTELSGGEQQRVAIVRALMNRPRLILADEPTGNLDTKTGAEVIQLLLDACREAGAALMIITHDERIAARAHRVIRLVDGRLSAAGAA